jgi:N-methylhydantoinase A
MLRAMTTVAAGDADALVSAGSTGAMVLAAAKFVPRIAGVERAALAAVYPTRDRASSGDRFALMVDVGATVRCRVRGAADSLQLRSDALVHRTRSRQAWFADCGHVETPVHRFDALAVGERVQGPALIESSFTTVVLPPGAHAQRRHSGSLAIEPGTGS